MRKPSGAHDVTLVFPTSAISKVEKMSGVFRFLSEGHHWNLSIIAPDAQPPDFSTTDGIIVTGEPSPAMRQAIERSVVPTVAIALDFVRTRRLVHVTTDGAAIGKAIAETFLRMGTFRSFAFIRPPKMTGFLTCYLDGLSDMIRGAGKDIAMAREDALDELWKLPRPLLVFATTDYIAAHVVSAGKQNRISIPEELSVLGFLNDTVFCENAAPRLSSLELDFERQGYLAAKALHALMTAKHAGGDLSAGLKALIRRETTPAPSPGEALVRRGITFIRRLAMKPIKVRDVVAHLKVSQRLAELRFREITGQTIISIILDERLEATKQMLKASDESIAAVCRHCGWSSENYPKRLFRGKYGLTMLEWRHNKTAALT